MFSLLSVSFEGLKQYLKEKEESGGYVSQVTSNHFKEFISNTVVKTVRVWLDYENYRRQVVYSVGALKVSVYLNWVWIIRELRRNRGEFGVVILIMICYVILTLCAVGESVLLVTGRM